MALELVTGYRGVLHITAPQDADLYRGLIGDGRLTVGNGMSVLKTGNTEVTVMDGVCVLDGREFFIGYEDSEIFSTEDMSGTMYLVITYEKDEDRHETARLELVESYADVDIRILPDISQKLLATLEISDEGIIESVTEALPVNENLIETISEAAAAATAAQEAAKAASEAAEGLDELKEQTEIAAESAENMSGKASAAGDSANEASERANNAAEAAEAVVEELADAIHSVDVGETITGSPGTSAKVTNTGTQRDVVLEFTIPRGDPGKIEGDASYVTGELDPVTGDVIFTTSTSLEDCGLVLSSGEGLVLEDGSGLYARYAGNIIRLVIEGAEIDHETAIIKQPDLSGYVQYSDLVEMTDEEIEAAFEAAVEEVG